jgi:hypothetical protein
LLKKFGARQDVLGLNPYSSGTPLWLLSALLLLSAIFSLFLDAVRPSRVTHFLANCGSEVALTFVCPAPHAGPCAASHELC